MLGIATPSTLGRYARRFEERCRRYPKAWYLAVLADDRCRSEFWGLERRRQERFHRDHPALSAFQADMPWESIIKESTTNVEFWMRELQEPALVYSREHSDVAPSWVDQQAAQGKGAKRTWDKADEGHQNLHPKKDKGYFITNRDGKGICRTYSNGACARGEECAYAHQCNKCLGNHPRAQCPNKGKQKGKNKKGRGKGADKGSH